MIWKLDDVSSISFSVPGIPSCKITSVPFKTTSSNPQSRSKPPSKKSPRVRSEISQDPSSASDSSPALGFCLFKTVNEQHATRIGKVSSFTSALIRAIAVAACVVSKTRR